MLSTQDETQSGTTGRRDQQPPPTGRRFGRLARFERCDSTQRRQAVDPVSEDQERPRTGIIVPFPVAIVSGTAARGVGTRIDFGILGHGRYRRPRLTAWILIAVAAGLLAIAIQAGARDLPLWEDDVLNLRTKYLNIVTSPRIPLAVWCLVLSAAALIAARRLYSNR